MNKNQEIQDFILAKIKGKEYEAGTQIPTENELMEQFNVSRMTVNKALNTLRNKGYLYSVRGKGTFVKKEVVNKKLNELTSFTEEMKSRGITPVTKTLELAYTSMGFEEEKESLGLEPQDNIYKIVRVRYNNDLPIALDVTLLNEKVTGSIEFSEMGTSLFEFLQKKIGIEISYAVQKIKAVKADEFLSVHLEVPVGDPILKITGVTYDVNNRPFELVHTFYVHDAYEFEQISMKNT